MNRLYVAVPTHNNSLTVDTAIALIDLEKYLPQTGTVLKTAFHSSSMLSHLRNTIVAHFMADEATHLLMLDSDQHIPPELVERMIKSDLPVVGVIYPRRTFALNQVRQTNTALTPESFMTQAMHFVGDLLPNETGDIQIINGFARAQHIGTGAMLIKREAILLMMQHYPDLHGAGFPAEAEYAHLAPLNWGFFNLLTKQHDTRNTGEDTAFCQRWMRIGGELWADIITNTTHIGRHAFTGNYLAHLKSLVPPQ